MTPIDERIASTISCRCTDGYTRALCNMTCNKCFRAFKLHHAKHPERPLCKAGGHPKSFDSLCVATYEQRGAIVYEFTPKG